MFVREARAIPARIASRVPGVESVTYDRPSWTDVLEPPMRRRHEVVEVRMAADATAHQLATVLVRVENRTDWVHAGTGTYADGTAAVWLMPREKVMG